MRKRNLFIFTLLILSIASLYAQKKYTHWKPIKFLNNPPEWVHIPEDTTIPDFEPILTGKDNFQPITHILTKKYVFQVYKSVYNTLDGLMVDKVDLQSGKQIASFVYDKRQFDYELHPEDMYINMDGYLEIPLRVRYVIPYKSWVSHLGILQLDTADLSLIDLQYTDFKDSTVADIFWLPHRLGRATDSSYYYWHDLYDFDTINNEIFYKRGLECIELDPQGYRIWDTTIFFFKHLRSTYILHKRFNYYNQYNRDIWKISSDTLMYLAYSHYADNSIDAVIHLFDPKLNEIGNYDIHTLFDSSAVLWDVIHTDSKYIYLEARKLYPGSRIFWKKKIGFILDHKGNLVERIEYLDEKGLKMYGPYPVRLQGVEGTIVFESDFRDSTFEVWKTNGHGQLAQLRSSKFDPSNCMFYCNKVSLLPDGDLLTFGLFYRDTTLGDTSWGGGDRRVYVMAKPYMRFKKKTLGLDPLGNQHVSFDKETYKLSPNPASEYLTVQFTSPFFGTIELIDAMGKTQLYRNIQGDKRIKIDLKSLSPGWYSIYPVREKDGIKKRLQTNTFIVEP